MLDLLGNLTDDTMQGKGFASLLYVFGQFLERLGPDWFGVSSAAGTLMNACKRKKFHFPAS